MLKRYNIELLTSKKTGEKIGKKLINCDIAEEVMEKIKRDFEFRIMSKEEAESWRELRIFTNEQLYG